VEYRARAAGNGVCGEWQRGVAAAKQAANKAVALCFLCAAGALCYTFDNIRKDQKLKKEY
jgi:hypothetical protein